MHGDISKVTAKQFTPVKCFREKKDHPIGGIFIESGNLLDSRPFL